MVEAHLQALGTVHAIAHCFTKKDAMKDFRRLLMGSGKAKAKDSDNMAELRRRIASLPGIQVEGSK